MKPLMMKFHQGQGDLAREIYVNMNLVCYIAPEGVGSAFYFAAEINGEAAFILVNETPDEIGKRHEWNGR